MSNCPVCLKIISENDSVGFFNGVVVCEKCLFTVSSDDVFKAIKKSQKKAKK